MFELVVLFLGVSLLFYCLFAGADFGAGMLELFNRPKFRDRGEKITYQAIGPVWEANHIWLILVIVILFMAFPAVYTAVSVALHIPLSAMLVGIVLRGCFFTFRHYDAYKDQSHRYYSGIFIVSSFWTSLFLGIIAGSLILGRIDPTPTDFHAGYIEPWFNWFSGAVGLFACCIFSFLAAVFLTGEACDAYARRHFFRLAWAANLVTVLAGAAVFLAAEAEGLPLLRHFFGHPLSMACLVLATLSLPVLWIYLRRGNVVVPRLMAGFQVCMILLAWLWIQYPVMVSTTTGTDLTLFNARAPEATMRALGWALLVGAALIFPALIYLLRAFKLHPAAGPAAH